MNTERKSFKQKLREEFLQTTDTLWNNEVRANIFVARILIGTAITCVAALALSWMNVFTINNRIMFATLIQAAIEFLIPAFICLYFKGERRWIKLMLMIVYVIVIGRVTVVLGHNVVLLLAFPPVLSSRYYSRYLTIFVSSFTFITYAIASWFGVALGLGRVDLNMVELPAGTELTIPSTLWLRDAVDLSLIDYQRLWLHFLQHSFLPKLLLFVMIALLCINVARRGRSSILEQKAETEKTQRLATELDLASNIQTAMLPNMFPAFPEREEFDIYASMEPAKEVGGDFYDFFMLDDDHLAMVIADVSGKGIPAAMFMMASKIIISNYSKMGETDPGRILEISNDQIAADNPAEMFVTVWLGILDVQTGILSAANAGHEYPCVRRGGGGFELFKDRHGMVLGAMDGISYKSYEVQLEPGDAVFVYTDGVAEANNAKQELFGTDRLLEALNRDPDAESKILLSNVTDAVAAYVQDEPQFDDTTMLAVKYMGVK